MNSRKPKQDVEYLIEWETQAHGTSGPQLQLIEAVPNLKAPAKPVWGASSELVFADLGSPKPRSRLH